MRRTVQGLDLNLFVAFESLMETHNGALGSNRLGLSQPAASAVIAWLCDKTYVVASWG
ncbi:hypothetical protein [Sphingomonas glacialis]|uniref:hypothetical protein n=1 Tax=Sphingomonas glacialis TaxID=658225 RepID=UPI001386E220|nr:hypothetical protein [Sphingomonas glacialis]